MKVGKEVGKSPRDYWHQNQLKTGEQQYLQGQTGTAAARYYLDYLKRRQQLDRYKAGDWGDRYGQQQPSTPMPGGGVPGGGTGGTGPGAPDFKKLYEDFFNKMNQTFTKAEKPSIDPSLFANLMRGKQDTQRKEEARRRLLNMGLNPSSMAFQREMDRIEAGEEAQMYDALGKITLQKPQFELQQAGTLGNLLGQATGMGGVLSNYIQGMGQLGSQNYWAGQNRSDYMNLLGNLFGLDPWGQNQMVAWG